VQLVTDDAARAAAEAVDAAVARGDDPGPLAGVPIALKDNLCTRGVPTTCSSKILEGWRPPYTATVVERVLAAGAVPVAKTNLDEFAMGSSTENSAFGATRNPRDPSRVRAVRAVARRRRWRRVRPARARLRHGGSIRQPAALCGVVGVKPTYGLCLALRLVAFASSLDQIGPFATTVSDAALLLDVIAGTTGWTPPPSPPPRPVLPVVDRGVEGLRIAIVDELVEGDGVPTRGARRRRPRRALVGEGRCRPSTG
jgi:aspartyl-tRNA(Asn)/glutamyl-tRNA(Gln) amidotransferase subunit A